MIHFCGRWKWWNYVIIIKKCEKPMSCMIKDKRRKVYRRISRHLKINNTNYNENNGMNC